MPETSDIVIVGGGVIGLTTAYVLAREGLRVRIVDQGDFGREASWAGAGILPPGNPAKALHPLARLGAESAAIFPTLSQELRQRTGIDNGYRRCGGLELVAADDADPQEEWRSEGIVCQTVKGSQLKQLEPHLAPSLSDAYHLPDMAQLRNPWHINALKVGCDSLGVVMNAGCPVTGFDLHGNHVSALRTGLGRMTAARYLLAAGAWSGGLLEELDWQAAIRPIRGQIALLKTDPSLLRRIVLWGSRYLVPRADGRVLVGSTEENAGFAKQTTAEAVADLLSMATRLVPALSNAHVEKCWAGLRPGSPDDLPILGRLPPFENVYIASGHFRAGIQLSPGTALVMKELLLGQPLTVPLECFSIERFA